MSFTATGTGRIRVIGFDNYDADRAYIVAWKVNTYDGQTYPTKPTDGEEIASIATYLKYKTLTGEVSITLPEDTYNFSCAITYPYMAYTYSDGSRDIGSITTRKLVIINIETGATGTFENEELLMTTDGQPDLTAEGFARYRTLVACGIRKAI